MATYTKPIVELALEDLQATVEDVTEDNGYSFDVRDVVRIKREGDVAIDRRVYLIPGDREPVENPCLGHEEFYQPFSLWITTIDSDTSTVPIEAKMYQRYADIQKAITSSTTNNAYPGYQRSGYALNTTVDARPDWMQDVNEKLVGIILNGRMHIRHLYSDQFTDG